MAPDVDVSTKAKLETALDRLIVRAYESGVDVANGGYELRHDGPELPDWEIHITRTVKPSRPE